MQCVSHCQPNHILAFMPNFMMAMVTACAWFSRAQVCLAEFSVIQTRCINQLPAYFWPPPPAMFTTFRSSG